MGQVIENLKNIQPIEFNRSLINDSDLLVQNSIQNLNNNTDGIWFMFVTFLMFILLIWLFTKEDGPFKLDFARSILVSSGWCLIISVGAVIFTLTQTILPVIWFSTIFFLSGLMVYNRSEKGR